MTFESALEEIVSPEQRLSATKLVDLSNLDGEDTQRLAETWPEIDERRRFSIVSELRELADDNVDLNFDAVFRMALTDDSPLVRAAAVLGLYEYEGRDLISIFADMLRNDPDPDVRREAAIALGRYALAAELGQLRDSDCDLIRDVLEESVEDEDEDERVRARAIEALGAISGEETDNLIESIYGEDSLWLKVGALDAMGRSCNDVWLPIILREIEHPAPEMRHAAVFAAGEIGDERAVQALKRAAIEDPDADVQRAAVHALGEIGGPESRVALKAILYEGDDSLNEDVEEALAEAAFADDPLGF